MNMKKILMTMALVALMIPALSMAQATLTPQMQRVMDDVTRLQAILVDSGNTQVTFSAATWRTVANEANALANRVYGRTSSWRTESRTAARELRHHVREMRSEALKGNAEGARKHAAEALPFANTLAGRIRGSM
jgi:hypothetical protein